MSYTLTMFYLDERGREKRFADPLPIAAEEFEIYRASAGETIEGLMAAQMSPGGARPLGLHISNASGAIIFSYIRPPNTA